MCCCSMFFSEINNNRRMSMEMSGGGGGGGGGATVAVGGGFDPSNLRLKKEFEEGINLVAGSIRATCILQGPSRSFTTHVDGNVISSSSEQFLQLPFHVNSSRNNDKGNVNVREKEKERRRSTIGRGDVGESNDEESSLIRDESEDVDCLSDARNGGGNYYSSDKCNDIPVSRHSVRKKSRRSNYSSTSWKHHKQILLSKRSRNVMDGSSDFRLGSKSSISLIGEFDDTVNYYNSENLRRVSAVSPLLAGLRNKNWPHSPRKLRSHNKEDDSDSYSAPSSKRCHNKYLIRNPSVVESLGSFNEADDEVDDHLDLPVHQGCGIPCNWSKRSTSKPKSAYDSCYSSSVSDTLRRKQLSETQIMHQRRNHNSLLKNSDDELSTKFGELDLKALDELREEESSGSVKTLSQKYRPVFFHEVIGHNMVIQSLTSAISNRRIFPFYLFHGPRGTGKTSTARMFAAAINCLAIQVTRPCGVCMECSSFISGKSKYLIEVDGSNKKGIYDIKYLSKIHPSGISKYRVIVVDDCHLLPSKAWLIFLRLLKKPLPGVIFVLVTTDIDNLPHSILARCQKHVFEKISVHDIVNKLSKIASDEDLDVESDALELIASNADGSLQDAETMLDQMSLFGKRVTLSLVTEIIGVVSDDKLLELLELAMSSNANETVTRAQELLNSGVDPIALMSQMATIIVDIIAGTYPGVKNPRKNHSPFCGKSLSESEKDGLKHALTLLSEAAKHIRVSNEGSIWFTAILLQLGSLPSPNQAGSGSNHVQTTSKATKEDHISTPCKSIVQCSPTSIVNTVSHTKDENVNSNPNQSYSKILLDIWHQCVEKCHSKTLRLLLQSYGKLVSVSETKDGGFVAQIGFGDDTIKTTAEGFLSSITNSFEIVLRHNVEVKIILLPDSSSISSRKKIEQNISRNLENRSMCSNISGEGFEFGGETSKLSIQSFSVSKSHQKEKFNLVCGNANASSSKVNENSANRIDSLESMNYLDMFSKHWEGNLNRDMKALKIKDGTALHDKSIKKIDNHPVSRSLLHDPNPSSNLCKENMGYESGSGAGGWTGLLCWKSTRAQRKRKGKGKKRESCACTDKEPFFMVRKVCKI